MKKESLVIRIMTGLCVYIALMFQYSCSEETNETWSLPDDYEKYIPDDYFKFVGGVTYGSVSSSGSTPIGSVSINYQLAPFSYELDYWGLMIKRVDYYIDDNLIYTATEAPYKIDYSDSNISVEEHQFVSKITIGGAGKKDVVVERTQTFGGKNSGNSSQHYTGNFWVDYDTNVKKGEQMVVTPYIVAERSTPGCSIKKVRYTWDGVEVATKTEAPFLLEYLIEDDEGSTHSLGLDITYGGGGSSDQTFLYTIGGIRVMDKNTASPFFDIKSSLNINSEYEFKNGETLSALAKTYLGEESTVKFSLNVYWDGELIAQSSSFPYELDYKIENMSLGKHELKYEWIREDSASETTFSNVQTRTISIIE